jgi:uncharacterized protein (TIGR02466 family)
MAGHDADAGFEQLWPTIIAKRTIPGHEAPNQSLLALIERLESGNASLTTDYRRADLLARNEPAAQWLTQCINVTVRDYFAHLGMNYDIRWSVHGWANVNRFGDYHDSHNHPYAYLSGTYYVQVPTDLAPRTGRNDLRPGCLSLYDPRAAVNMNAIKGDPYINPEHTIAPTPGLIVMWPSFINHFVHPNLAQQSRVSVSFNVMLDWSDEYLPQQ